MSSRRFDPAISSDLLNRLFRRVGDASEGSASRRSGSKSPTDLDRSRVKRALFGPVDHEENRRFVEQELARGQLEMKAKYNYDFSNDQPLEGRWKWETFVPQPNVPIEGAKSVAESSVSELKDEQKENSLSVNVTATATPTITTTTAAANTTSTDPASESVPSCSVVVGGASSSACDKSKSVSTPFNSSSRRPSSQRSSAVTRAKITDHFPQRKRSRSKVKTQERKTDDENTTPPLSLSLPSESTSK